MKIGREVELLRIRLDRECGSKSAVMSPKFQEAAREELSAFISGS
jgi:hypothetical protein